MNDSDWSSSSFLFESFHVSDIRLSKKQKTKKLRFYRRLCQFLMKIIPVINWVCACVKTSVDYLTGEFLRFGLTEKALFHEILGLLLVYADWEKRGVCSKSVYVRVFYDLELLR